MTKPQHMVEVIDRLGSLPGIEVHQSDPESGKIVVVQEAEDIQAELEAIKCIKALPHVILAEMVYHYIAEDEKTYEALPPELQPDSSEACAVPTYLQN